LVDENESVSAQAPPLAMVEAAPIFLRPNDNLELANLAHGVKSPKSGD
jgi:hypothetical protein